MSPRLTGGAEARINIFGSDTNTQLSTLPRLALLKLDLEPLRNSIFFVSPSRSFYSSWWQSPRVSIQVQLNMPPQLWFQREPNLPRKIAIHSTASLIPSKTFQLETTSTSTKRATATPSSVRLELELLDDILNGGGIQQVLGGGRLRFF